MGKLFLFGIGGTGSRVIKSLIMQLASGIKINATEVVPIIIDPDQASGNLTETKILIKKYVEIYNSISANCKTEERFFNTKINTDIYPKIIFNNTKIQNNNFREFLKLSELKNSSDEKEQTAADFISLLFSEQNLNMKLDVGFKGNPNVGSVVLNEFQSSQDFKDICSHIEQNDRIFIISSIFGGTGASGYPLLIKNLRALDSSIANSATIKNSFIGSLTVMPYFDLKSNDNSQIDSSTFILKTREALTYYKDNMKESDITYYIGDTNKKQYDNNEGGDKQKNKAHLIEFISALAINNFMDVTTKPTTPEFKEFGISNYNDDSAVNLISFDSKTTQKIKKPLIRFTYFNKYCGEYFKDTNSDTTTWIKDNGYNDNFTSKDFYLNMKKFGESYWEWLKEMEDNGRGFKPFNLEVKEDVFTMVNGISPVKILFTIDKNVALFNGFLNEASKKSKKSKTSDNDKFMDIFYIATNEIVTKKLNIR